MLGVIKGLIYGPRPLGGSRDDVTKLGVPSF